MVGSIVLIQEIDALGALVMNFAM